METQIIQRKYKKHRNSTADTNRAETIAQKIYMLYQDNQDTTFYVET